MRFTSIYTKKEIFISREGSDISVEIYYWAMNSYGVEYIHSAYTYESDMSSLPVYLKDFNAAKKLRIRRELLMNELVFLTVKI